MSKTVILCDCLGSQNLDAKRLSKALGLKCSPVHTALCTSQAEAAREAIASGEAIIACGQERAHFGDIAADLGAEPPICVDIRDRAGWSADSDATPKMAALIAEALLAAPVTKLLDVQSEGACLVIGAPQAALAAAERLAPVLAVTALLTESGTPPLSRTFDVVTGRIRAATGTLGNFRLVLDALCQAEPGGRGEIGFGEPRDGAESGCDIILDLSGGAALFPAHEKRDGYLRADPGDPNAVAAAVFEAAQLIGTFEKPLYVALEDHLCAHSRAGQIGCTRCLYACPTGAIRPDGDHVAIDPLICAGCGACSSLCPSGAVRYDAPPVGQVLRRIETLAQSYRAAGGTAPRLLVHDGEHGREMIELAARFGSGLPADVIPLLVQALAGFGHAEMLAALALGFSSVDLLLAPKSDREVIGRELALAEAISGTGRLRLLDIADPDALPDALYGKVVPAAVAKPVVPMGSRRQIARLAAKALNPQAEAPLPLPENAPYGAVLVDTDACTLCLSCASLCPTGALLDNPDKPQLSFQEDACLQCGLCANVCPENAITYVPRLDLSDAALSSRVLHEEEPFACIDCGKPFGVKSTVERIIDKLAGKHPMFATTDAGRLIQMCDDCRIKAQYHSAQNPFAAGERPKVRTTDDYLSKRRDH